MVGWYSECILKRRGLWFIHTLTQSHTQRGWPASHIFVLRYSWWKCSDGTHYILFDEAATHSVSTKIQWPRVSGQPGTTDLFIMHGLQEKRQETSSSHNGTATSLHQRLTQVLKCPWASLHRSFSISRYKDKACFLIVIFALIPGVCFTASPLLRQYMSS